MINILVWKKKEKNRLSKRNPLENKEGTGARGVDRPRSQRKHRKAGTGLVPGGAWAPEREGRS